MSSHQPVTKRLPAAAHSATLPQVKLQLMSGSVLDWSSRDGDRDQRSKQSSGLKHSVPQARLKAALLAHTLLSEHLFHSNKSITDPERTGKEELKLSITVFGNDFALRLPLKSSEYTRRVAGCDSRKGSWETALRKSFYQDVKILQTDKLSPTQNSICFLCPQHVSTLQTADKWECQAEGILSRHAARHHTLRSLPSWDLLAAGRHQADLTSSTISVWCSQPLPLLSQRRLTTTLKQKATTTEEPDSNKHFRHKASKPLWDSKCLGSFQGWLHDLSPALPLQARVLSHLED